MTIGGKCGNRCHATITGKGQGARCNADADTLFSKLCFQRTAAHEVTYLQRMQSRMQTLSFRKDWQHRPTWDAGAVARRVIIGRQVRHACADGGACGSESSRDDDGAARRACGAHCRGRYKRGFSEGLAGRLRERTAAGGHAFQVLQLHPLGHGDQRCGSPHGVPKTLFVLFHRLQPRVMLHVQVVQHGRQVWTESYSAGHCAVAGPSIGATSRSSPARSARSPGPTPGVRTARRRPRPRRTSVRATTSVLPARHRADLRRSCACPGLADAGRATCNAPFQDSPPRPLGRGSGPRRSHTARWHSRRRIRDSGNWFSQKRPVQSSSALARRAIFSQRMPINHETLLNRRRSLSIFFLSLASCSTRWGSGCGRSSDSHLASFVMVSQRRATS